MRKVAESTVRRLSLYLRFLEEFEGQGVGTVSSGALASRGGTASDEDTDALRAILAITA